MIAISRRRSAISNFNSGLMTLFDFASGGKFRDRFVGAFPGLFGISTSFKRELIDLFFEPV